MSDAESVDKILDGLKMTMDLMLFDPMTGETKTVESLNDLDRTTYAACDGAYKLIHASKVISEERLKKIFDKCLLTANATDDYKRLLINAILNGLKE